MAKLTPLKRPDIVGKRIPRKGPPTAVSSANGSGVRTSDAAATLTPEQAPTVSIGLPVRNGMPYLVEALDSILAQTYTDFELIISDNASTDETEAVCREYAARDSRIRYHRNPEDIGGGNNHNLTFNLSRGKYFHWAGSDDVLSPEFLEQCVQVLDDDPNVILCHTSLVLIDQTGVETGRLSRRRNPSIKPVELFSILITFEHDCEEICGLIRSSVLAQTQLISNYTDSDRTLLAQLALRGRFYEVQSPLFFKRQHPSMSTRAFPEWRSRMNWFGTRYASPRRVPHWQQLLHYVRLIATSPISTFSKTACYAHLVGWVVADRRWRWLLKDLALAVRDLLPKTATPGA